MTDGATIEGLQAAQDRNIRWVAALKPSGPLGKQVKDVTVRAHRYLVSITHIDTGAYKASQRMDYNRDAITGKLYVDPTARNPRTGARPAEYGLIEEARGGEHAAYARTQQYIERTLLRGAVSQVRSELT